MSSRVAAPASGLSRSRAFKGAVLVMGVMSLILCVSLSTRSFRNEVCFYM